MLQTINWFIKSRRAQNVDDYETWISGGVVPTLNVSDNTGDVRATVLIFYGNRVDDIRMQGDVINTLQARMGTGGGNMPIVAFDTYNQTTSNISQTIKSHSANNENIGVVAYSLREDAKANTFSATETETALTVQSHQPSPQSHHAQLFIVDTPMAFDTYNQTVSEKSKTLNSSATDIDHTGGVWEGSMVRRLTPTECERLQGFPDGWTEGQADTHRYKQMGNAVAVPVVSWLVNRLMEANK